MNTRDALRYLAGDRYAAVSEMLVRGGHRRRAVSAYKDEAEPRPWTLRDVRRYHSRGKTAGWRDWSHLSLADLDRLISRYGPDALASDVIRPAWEEPLPPLDELFDDDAAAARTDAGGVASQESQGKEAKEEDQEAPDGASRSEGSDGLRQQDEEAPEASTDDAASGDAGGAEPTRQGATSGGDEPSAGTGSQASASDAASDASSQGHGVLPSSARGDEAQDVTSDGQDVPGGDDGSPTGSSSEVDAAESGSGGGEAEAESAESGSGGGEAESDAAGEGGEDGGAGRGGDYLDAAEAEAAMRAARAKRDALRVVAALRRMVEAACVSQGNPSPRYDARRLVRELVSRRYALHRAARRERDIRDVVIAVDVSGSCQAVCAAMYAAAIQAASLLPRDRVAVVTHANGLWIRRVREFTPGWLAAAFATNAVGLEGEYFGDRHERACMAVWETIARRRPGLVLMLGDFDSHLVHELLRAAGVRVVLATHIEPEEVYGAEVTYDVIGGVVDAATAAAALERYERGQR